MCRLEKFHLPLRPNLKDWNMMTFIEQKMDATNGIGWLCCFDSVV